MIEILEELPLVNAIKTAILNREGALGAALQVVLDYEAGRARTIAEGRLAQIAPRQLRQSYTDAMLWADTLFSGLAACAA